MPTTVTIGDFSRLTLLSVKALRHYHEVGLLAPAEIDPSSGYRRYEVDQVETAQLIRHLRDLDMPFHAGPFTDFGRTYGALGRHVAEHCGSSGRPIRELYVIGPERTDDPEQYRTEICWPIGPA